jgi:hypothetical protein
LEGFIARTRCAGSIFFGVMAFNVPRLNDDLVQRTRETKLWRSPSRYPGAAFEPLLKAVTFANIHGRMFAVNDLSFIPFRFYLLFCTFVSIFKKIMRLVPLMNFIPVFPLSSYLF